MLLFLVCLLLVLITPIFAADCILVMPQFPLSNNGLLTPYRLQSVNPADPCTMENPLTATFVEATLFDIDTGHINVYHPLVVTDGKTPLIPPTPFTMTATTIISLSFGTNANTLRLTPPENVLAGRCVNGITGNDIFGQFAYCNSDTVLDAINTRINNGLPLVPPIPPLGMANDGKECLTTRHFMLVDQDPSDNLVTTYLLDPVTMKIFQDTVINRQTHPGFIILKNGSDNRLLVTMNTAMGCTGYLAPLLSDVSGAKTASLILNEIHATFRQQSPMVMLPSRDPMTRVIVNGITVPSMLKNNLYRRGINQPQLTSIQQADTLPFCGHLTNQLNRMQENKALFTTQPSPDMNAASNLFTFLSTRFFQTYNNLKCDVLLDSINPVILVVTNGITTDATFTAVIPYQFSGQDPYILIQPSPSPTSPNPPTTPPTTTPPMPQPSVSPNTQPEVNGAMIYYIAGGSVLFLSIITYCIYRYRSKTDENNEDKNEPILHHRIMLSPRSLPRR